MSRQSPGRIFVSYRRQSAGDFAGRLADTLGSYFGDDRVFQDVDHISAGAEFAEVLRTTLSSADAVLVVIDPTWLTIEDEHGVRRLGQPGDWVTEEVSAAIDADAPIFPVLVEDTPMPRSDELPELLRPLASRNALSLSRARWHTDAERLARSVAQDIPSHTERVLRTVRLVVSLALMAAVMIPTVVLVHNAWSNLEGVAPSPTRAPDDSADARRSALRGPVVVIETWTPAISFLLITPCAALLFVFARLVERRRRVYVYAAGFVGAIGAAVSFVLYYFVGLGSTVAAEQEALVVYLSAVTIAAGMMALIGIGGMKPK